LSVASFRRRNFSSARERLEESFANRSRCVTNVASVFIKVSIGDIASDFKEFVTGFMQVLGKPAQIFELRVFEVRVVKDDDVVISIQQVAAK